MTSESGLELTLSSPRALRLPKREPHVILSEAPSLRRELRRTLAEGRSEGSDGPVSQRLFCHLDDRDRDCGRVHQYQGPIADDLQSLGFFFLLSRN